MILGFSEGFHDAAVALVDQSNGDIVYATHSERLSGVKHDKHICDQLKETVLSNYSIDSIAFYEKILLKRARQLYAGQYKTALTPRKLAFSPNASYSHHLSHAAAAFQTSPYREASCIVVDSIGEWDTISIWSAHYDKDGYAKYKKLDSVRYPSSLGLWYSALTKYVGLKPLDEEYIFMGMAPFGKMDYDLYLNMLRRLKNHNNHKGIPENWFGDVPNEDIAYNAQEILDIELRHIFQVASSHSKNICYGGGVALNCVINAGLIERHKNVWIMPNPGDAGAALGAAALEYGKKLNWTSPYLGTNIDREVDVSAVVDYLLEKKMCGIANGRAEFGPRALGNRSLIADPRDPNIKDMMNDVKRRQKFRPFAPAILSEFADNYFDGVLTPYMSTTARCRFPKDFPGIVHVDNSSRVQVVRPNEPTILRKILEAWYAKTGCPMLLNTSLNIRGKPMVDTWQDALDFQNLYGVQVF